MKVIERQYSYFTKQTVDRLNDLARCAIQKVQSMPIVDLYTEHPIFRINSKNLLVQYKEFDEGANLIREARYAYDALGRRIEKVVTDLQVPVNNKTRRYVYDGEDILKVFDENNQVISKYTHSSLRVDDALAIDDKVNNKSYFFLKDHLGSIFDIVNEDNTFKQHYAYSSFGELQKVTDIGGNDVTANPALEHHFTYTGREYDQESGLYHYRARAYDASIGRFLQVDPFLGFIEGPLYVINKYIYALNNPIIYFDYSGEVTVSRKTSDTYEGPGESVTGVEPIDNFYGRYCSVSNRGPGKPVDSLDSACSMHDARMEKAASDEKFKTHGKLSRSHRYVNKIYYRTYADIELSLTAGTNVIVSLAHGDIKQAIYSSVIFSAYLFTPGAFGEIVADFFLYKKIF